MCRISEGFQGLEGSKPSKKLRTNYAVYLLETKVSLALQKQFRKAPNETKSRTIFFIVFVIFLNVLKLFVVRIQKRSKVIKIVLKKHF